MKLLTTMTCLIMAGGALAAEAAPHELSVTRIAVDGDIVGTPYIAADGTIFICDNDETIERISPDLKTIKKWKMSWGALSRPTPIDQSRILIAGKMGSIGIIDNKTNKLESKQTLPMQSVPAAPPTIVKNASGALKFLIPASNSKLYVVDDKLAIVREIDLPYDVVDEAVSVTGSPTDSSTQFVVNTIRGHVVFVDIASGKTKVVELKDEVRASPAVFQGKIYVFTKSGVIHVFDKTGKELKKLTHSAPFYYDAISLTAPPRLRLYDENGGIVDLTADESLHAVGKVLPPSSASKLDPVKLGHFAAPGASVHGVAYGDHDLRLFDAQTGKELGKLNWPTQIRSFVYSRGNEVVFAAPARDGAKGYELVVVKIER